MRGIAVLAISLGLASSAYAGGCGTVMTSFVSSDTSLAANAGGSALTAAMFFNGTLKPNIQRLESVYGMLQSIPVNVGTEAGTSSMNVNWTSFVISLAKKIGSSATADQDINYLLAPLGSRAQIVSQFAGRCRGRDGAENVVLMIDEAAEASVLPQFLGRSAIYMKNGNPHVVKKASEYDAPIGTIPYSRMPPI